MRTLPVWLTVAVLIGLLATLMLRRQLGRPGPAAPIEAFPGQAPEWAREQLEQLSEELEREREQRAALAADVDALRRDIDRLVASSDPEVEALLPDPASDSAPKRNDVAKSDRWFDEDSLREHGIDQAEISRLRQEFEQSELDELYLRDEAVREGWRRTPRYAQELTALRQAFRERLGEAAYDQMLYASGRNNRTVLGAMLGDSPAQSAGLLPGDVVLRYDGKPIFSGRELQKHTAGGRAGASTAVDVDRKGEELRFYVPRGPLGVRLRPTRSPPAS